MRAALQGFMLGAVCYVDDVLAEGAGAFTLWPNSLHATHAYFKRRPESVDGSYLFSPDVRA